MPQYAPRQSTSGFIIKSKKGLSIKVRVQTGASKSEVAGVVEGRLKIRLSARPHEGQANKALIELLSGVLNIRKTAVVIASGMKSRDKVIGIEGMDLATVEGALKKAVL
jgi:uncharacterized protein (TIGR00251 family)